MYAYLKAVEEIRSEAASAVPPQDLREAIVQDVFGQHLDAVLDTLLERDSQTARWVSQKAFARCADPLWMKEQTK